ncbi:MAG: hypothetical protein KIY11_05055 [Thermoplasmata archaeon]|nr:hypothetical protein [Candidatus Sysuiplasma acidicola]
MNSRRLGVFLLTVMIAFTPSIGFVQAGARPATAPTAPSAGRSAIVWMGLEITGENVSADLQSIGTHRGDLTGVSYEHYMLGSQGYFGPILGVSNVTGRIKSFGLQTYPMIISTNLGDIEYVIDHPTNFITKSVSKAKWAGYTGYNIDFEPTQMANASVAGAYASFLTAFADALHKEGKKLTVDIATWNPIWNFTELANTTVNTLYDMSTYASPSFNFAAALGYANATIPHSKLGVGLITVNVNTGALLQNYSVSARFIALQSDGVLKIAIWDMPLASYWWPYLHQFVGAGRVQASTIPIQAYAITAVGGLALAAVAALFVNRRRSRRAK